MGFWARLFGREVDTTVSEYQARVAAAPRPTEAATIGGVTGSVRFTAEDVFVITGRGTVVTGRVDVGAVSVGDVLEWTHPDGTTRSASVSAIEAFRKTMDRASAGELVGLLLPGVDRDDVAPGTVLSRR